MAKSKQIPFHEVVAALLDHGQPFSPGYLHRFSDLEGDDLRDLRNSWNKIETTRRLVLLNDLEEMADTDTLVDFDQVALIGLTDSDGTVRAQAARMLWENEDPKLVNILTSMVAQDTSSEARAAAAATLGKYIYLGELEELAPDLLRKAEECLLAAGNTDPDALVQRKSIEALGFSSRPEVPALIQKAYESRDHEWVSSALLAMGRSYDKVWEPDVRRELQSPYGDVQIEAIRAAGELSLDSSRRILLDLLEEEGTDSEIRAETIWALSEIGGEQVRDTLEDLLEETDDEEEAELIDEALDNLTLNEQIETMDLFDIDLEEEARSGHIVDLSLLDGTEGEDGGLESGEETDTDNAPSLPKSRRRHKKS